MGLSFDKYKNMMAENKFFWDTDRMSGTAQNIKDYLEGFNGQMNGSEERWSDDEYRARSEKLGALRGDVDYLKTYANTFKTSDPEKYNKLTGHARKLSEALDGADKWLKSPTAYDEAAEYRRQADELKKAAQLSDAVSQMKQGKASASDLAEKYGLDEDELNKTYSQVRQYEKQTDRAEKYNGMSFDELTGIIKDKKNIGKSVYELVNEQYKYINPDQAGSDEKRWEIAFKDVAGKFGLSGDEVKELYNDVRNDRGHLYDSYSLSDEDKSAVFSKIIETGSAKQLEELKAGLPSAGYYEGMKKQLEKAIEEKNGEETRKKYSNMSFDELVGEIKNPDRLGQLVYDDIVNRYGVKGAAAMVEEGAKADGLGRVTDGKTYDGILDTYEKKWGLSKDQIKEVIKNLSTHDDHHYESYVMSNEDKSAVFSKIIETGSAKQLEELKASLPSSNYYDGLRKQLNQAIEDKSEDEYYLSVKEKYPNIENSLDDAEYWAKWGVDVEKYKKFRDRYRERQGNVVQNAILGIAADKAPVTASLASVPINMIGSVGDAVRYAGAGIDKLSGGDGYIDPKSTVNYKAQLMRDTVSKNIDNPWGQFLYNTGMSMADSGFAMAVNQIPVVGQFVSGTMFFSSAGVSAANEVIENGGSIDQAGWTLLTQGAAELVFEKVSLENLEALKASKNTRNVKDFVKNVLKQSLTEGSEEVFTSLSNFITDGIINGDLSEFQRNKQRYIESGMSEGEANGQAVWDFFGGLFADFAGGAVSGAGFGALGSTKSHFNYKSAMKNTTVTLGGAEMSAKDALKAAPDHFHNLAQELVNKEGFDVRALTEIAKEASEDGKARALAESIENTAKEKGRNKITAADIENLLTALYKENIDARVTGEHVKSADVWAKVDSLTRAEQESGAVKEYNDTFDLSGQRRVESSSEESGNVEAARVEVSSFGKAHPNGIAAFDKNGKNIVVKGVESVVNEYGKQDRTVSLMLDDGSTVDADEVEFTNPDIKQLVELAKSYDTIGARALLSNYEEAKAQGVSLETYKDAFAVLYDVGQDGTDFEYAVKNPKYAATIQQIGTAAAQAAVEAGNHDAEQSVKTRSFMQKQVKVKGRTLSESRVRVERGVTAELSEDLSQVLQVIAEKTGKEIVVTNAMNSEDKGAFSDNRIYLNAEHIDDAAVTTALHEGVHNMAAYSAEDFRTLEKFVMNYYAETGVDVDKLKDKIKATYGQDAPTPRVVREEIVAKAVESIVSDEKALRTALECKANKGLIEKIGDILKRIVDFVSKYFKGDKANGLLKHNEYAQAFLDNSEKLQQMSEIVSRGFENAKANEQTYGSRESGAKFAKDQDHKTFDSIITIDDVKKVQSIAKAEKSFSVNDFTSKDIELTKNWAKKFYKEFGEKSPFFRAWFGDWRANEKSPVDTIQLNSKGNYRGKVYNSDVGIDIDTSRIGEKHILNHHHSNDFAYKVLGSLKEITEKAILLDTHVSTPTGKTKHKNTSFMHSFYTPVNYKNKIFVVKLFVEEYYNEWNNSIQRRNYDVSKIEILADADRFGGNNPAPLQASASISIKNIADLHAFVKQNDPDFNPPEASKVVDAEGKPLVMYHQTDADFTVFNTESNGAGRYDDETPSGIFLKPSDNDIGLKGKKQMALYANIRNPLQVNNRNDLVQFYSRNISGYIAAKQKIKDIDATYKAKFEEEEKRENQEYQKLWEAWRRGEITKEEYKNQTKRDKLEEIMQEWEERTNEAREDVKSLISAYFRNGPYDGIIIEQDAGSFGRSTKTFIALEQTQVKSAIDNIGTFDKSNPDIRYSKDDTIYDIDEDELWSDYEETHALDEIDPETGWTIGEVIESEMAAYNERRVTFNKLMEQNPDEAALIAMQATAKTIQRTLRSYNGVKLSGEDYERIARKVMRQYGIKEKGNEELVAQIAADVAEFVGNVKKFDKGSMTTFISALAAKCRKYLENSGSYERNELQKQVKDFILGLRGRTLILDKYDQDAVLDDYDDSVKRLRRQFRGYVNIGLKEDEHKYKHPIHIDDVLDSFADIFGDGGSLGERNYLFPNGERPFSIEAWQWLADMIEFQKPKFVNLYLSGEVESIESAALEMAYELATEAAATKGENAAKAKNLSRAQAAALMKERNTVKAEQKALYDAKKESYKRRLEEAEKKYGRAQERYQKEHMRRELAEEDLSVLKALVASDTKNFRQQYISRVRAQNDIEAVRRNINKLRTMIMNPTNEKFIPAEILHNKVFLNAVEALGEGIVLNNRSKVAEKMAVMLAEVRTLKDGESDFDTAFDDEFTAALQNVADWLKLDTLEDSDGTRRKISRAAFSNEEIGELRQLVDEIVYRIENARKLLMRRDGMLAQEASEKVIRQTRDIDDGKAAKVRKMFAGYAQQMMNPLRAVNQLSNYREDSELKKLFYEINEGQRKRLFWEMNAEKMFAEVTEKYEEEYRRACNDVIHFDYTVEGKGYHLDMTMMQALQVMMTWRREAGSNMNHMRRGGIVVADPKVVAKGKGRAWENAQRVPVSYDLVNQIIKKLGKFEEEYIKTAENYFNKISKDAINETFMVTRHREIARAGYYIPVKVDQNFSKAEISSLKFDFTIEGAGSYKHITPHAPQPIMIESLNSVIDRHITQTGKLYGLDIPLINFKRMFKGTTNFASEGTEWFQADSVKKALSDKFGSKSVEYIEKTIAAIEGGRDNQSRTSRIAEFLYTTRVKTSLVGNLGVVIKQAASYLTAGLYLSAKDLSVGLGKFAGKALTKNYKNVIKEIDAHTAQHYQRRKGLSVQEVSDMLHKSKLVRKAPTPVNPVKWIQAMDCVTTAALWEATKANIDGKYKKNGKQTGTDEYWQDVTKLYDTVIEDTQPMYDELHRSEFQKDGTSLKKFVFPFITQPMQNMGILADAAGELLTNRDKSSAKKFSKAVSSQMSSLLVFSVMTFAAALMRHKADRYKDDEDKLTVESVLPEVMWDMLTNGIHSLAPVGGDYAIPLIQDVANSIENNKLKFDNIKSGTELSLVNDWFTKMQKATNLLIKQVDGENKAAANPWDYTWRVLDVPGTFSEILGVPYSNISLLFKSAGNYVKDTQNYGLTNNYGELKTDHITNHILNAYEKGDSGKADKLSALWVEQYMSEGKTREKAQVAVNNKISAGLTTKADVKEAAQAKTDGALTTHKEIKDKYLEMGISEDVFDKAVRMLTGESKSEYEYTYQNAVDAYLSGDKESYQMAREELISTKVSNGKTREEAEKTVDSELKKRLK